MFLGGVGRLLRALGGGTTFSPVSLFANGEQGVWYQNSDFSTLFQDSIGTTPVTALEQPVGLRLDKSKGLTLGSELVTNGDFSNGTTGWTAKDGSALSVSGSDLSVNALIPPAVNNFGGVYQSISLQSGKSYKVTVAFKAVSTNLSLTVRTNFGSAGGEFLLVALPSSSSQNNTVSAIFNATATTSKVLLIECSGTAGTFVIDNISVRELPGNHAFQSTPSARPVLSARVNLLTQTEDFSNAVWERVTRNILAFGSGSTVNATIAPNGTTTADLIVPDTSTNVHYIGAFNTTSLSLAAGTYKLVCYSKPKPNGYSWISLQLGFSGSGARAYFDVANGAKGTTSTYGSGFSVTSYNIFPESNDFYRCEATITSSSASIGYAEILVSNGDGDANLFFAGDGTKGIYIWGADLRAASESSALPVYQRVGAATYGTSTSVGNPDYDSTGFPPYLIYDGGDWMQTNSIDFSATDKMSVFAGVRKLSDAAAATLLEFGSSPATTSGSFALNPGDFNNGTGPYWIHGARGTAALASNQYATTGPDYAAPITNILTGLSDIAGDLSIIRVNSLQQAIATGDKGSGNFANAPIYIGARAGTSQFYTGRDYGFVIVGRGVNAAELAGTENYMDVQTFGRDMILVYSDELTTATGDLITAADGDQIYMTVNYQ